MKQTTQIENGKAKRKKQGGGKDKMTKQKGKLELPCLRAVSNKKKITLARVNNTL